MFFNIFGRRKRPVKTKQTAAADGFQSLVTGLKGLSVEEMPNTMAVVLVLSVVDLTVRVLVNVAVALGDLTAPFVEQYPLKRPPSRNARSPSPVSAQLDGRQSVRGRPLHLDSISIRSDDESSIRGDISPNEPLRSQRFSFDKPRVVDRDRAEEQSSNTRQTSALLEGPQPAQIKSMSYEPEHELLKGFVRTPSAEKRDERRPPRARHLSLEERHIAELMAWSPEPFPYNMQSPFMQDQEELSCGEYTDTETVERVDSLGTIPESDGDAKENLKESKAAAVVENKEIEFTSIETSTDDESKQFDFEMTEKTKIKEESKITQDDFCESPCSSPRSVFSDSAATKFVNSNFCNPEFCEDPIDTPPSPCVGGSIRQKYTMKRLQSLLSQRSRVTEQTPSLDGKSSLGRPPRTPRQDSMRSFRGRSFRCPGVSSFRSRSGEEDEYHVLSDAYRLVKLESCIRKAWKVSLDDAQQAKGGNESFRERESNGNLSPSMQSLKRRGSRRFDRAHRISFVKVPADFSNEMLMSRREMLLNPAFGDEDLPAYDEVSEMSGVEDEPAMDASSVAMRTPLIRMGSTRGDYEKCEKNLEEGVFDNPMRLCSFRSYDSDTELELTSVRVRNPISRLLSYRLNRGENKESIPLADIDSDEIGAMMFDRMKANSMKGGMMEKYLTQLVIDDTLEAHLMGDAPIYADEDSLGWSTCQQEWVPHEMDNRLKCFLMDRFLIDNVLNEVELNPAALKNAAAKEKNGKHPTTSRKLRRS